MKKRKVSRSEMLGRVASMSRTDVAQSEPRETLQSFQHKYDAEQDEIRNAPIRAQQTEHSRLLKQSIELDIPTLYIAPSSFLDATCENIGDGSKFDNISPEEIRATIRRTFSDFEGALAGTLTESGKQKVQSLARANLRCDPTVVSTWHQMFYLLRAAGELGEEDFIPTSQRVAQEQPLNVDEAIEMMDCSTREGQTQARNLLAGQLFNTDAKVIFAEWVTSLDNNFNFVPTPSEQRAAIDIFTERNLSFLSRKSYDEVRKTLVNRGLWPERCLTNADRAEILVETTDARSYQSRQDLKAKLAILNK